jgi:hypothetical protein
MARTIAQIKAALVAAKAAEADLAGVTSTSKVAEWNLWLDVVAFCTYTLEQLFDLFRSDVDAKLATMKPHTLQWYVTKAKAFQLGPDLPPDSDVYEVVPPLDESSLIVKSAAAEEYFGLNLLRIKVAKESSGILAPLADPAELDPLKHYMGRIKDAGVRLQVTSGNPDDLKLSLEVYYDPLVLDASGARLDGTEPHPVKKVINAFLASLPFNGVFILNELIDALEVTEGVEIAHIVHAEANYALTSYVTIDVKYTPDAGYMVLNDTYFDTHIVYIPYSSEVV